ncbi:hypothetical protein [Streptomyces spiralis]|uniref:hypothetical protein n=1 Tax=Streptomyces spiralis TaxID=66376 RepID=UPI0036AD530C
MRHQVPSESCSPRYAARSRPAKFHGGRTNAGLVGTRTRHRGSTHQVGSVLGLAALAVVATSRGAGQLGNLPALTDGFGAAFVRSAAIAAVGGIAG